MIAYAAIARGSLILSEFTESDEEYGSIIRKLLV